MGYGGCGLFLWWWPIGCFFLGLYYLPDNLWIMKSNGLNLQEKVPVLVSKGGFGALSLVGSSQSLFCLVEVRRMCSVSSVSDTTDGCYGDVVSFSFGEKTFKVPLEVVVFWPCSIWGKNVAVMAMGMIGGNVDELSLGGYMNLDGYKSSFYFSDNFPTPHVEEFYDSWAILAQGIKLEMDMGDLGVVYYDRGKYNVFTVSESLTMSGEEWAKLRCPKYSPHEEKLFFVTPEGGLLNLPHIFVDAYVKLVTSKHQAYLKRVARKGKKAVGSDGFFYAE